MRMSNTNDPQSQDPASVFPDDMQHAASEMEYLTHVDAASDELAACRLEVIDREKHSLN